MTKKDYIALARAISTLPDATRSQACATVGMVLRVDNPLFDMERFAKACGVTEGSATTARRRLTGEPAP